MCLSLVGLAVSYLVRYFSYYGAFGRSGWKYINHHSVAVLALLSLVFGVLIPASSMDMIGILLRLLIMTVFVIVISGDDLSEAFGLVMVAAAFEVVASFIINIAFPWMCINPFAIP